MYTVQMEKECSCFKKSEYKNRMTTGAIPHISCDAGYVAIDKWYLASAEKMCVLQNSSFMNSATTVAY